MGDLPVLLAGPIVRRVEPASVSIWAAFSTAQEQVAVSIWNAPEDGSPMFGNSVGNSGEPEDAENIVRTRPFAARLHVALVTVTKEEGAFMPGSRYYYDLTFSDENGVRQNLYSQGLLVDEDLKEARRFGVHPTAPPHLALGYMANLLPSFVVPPVDVAALCIAHGSCRCTNAPARDAMAFLDDHLANPATAERPQQLFLTGDQIYADDVAAPILPMLTAIGRDLLGAEEVLPLDNNITATTQQLPAMRRQQVTRRDGGMTSLESDNHLLGFGEYAAMYLAYWGNGVWREPASDDVLFAKLPTGPDSAERNKALTDWEKCRGGWEQWKLADQDRIDRERAFLESFRAAVPKAARALANVATYMIFDDHEVTDDWNLGKQWSTRVMTKPLGKAVLRNAMLAYAIFQGWGNDPDAFARTPPNAAPYTGGNNADVLDAGAELFFDFPDALEPALSYPRPDATAALTMLEQRCGLVSGAATTELATWHYRIAFPSHQVAVLDSRTRRGFLGKLDTPPPQLLGSTLNEQIPPGTPGSNLLFVVSPAVVLEPGSFARLGRPITGIVWDLQVAWSVSHKTDLDPCLVVPALNAAEKYDAEGWAGNELAREELLNRLATYERCVILSGDVHCSSTMVLDHWRKNPANPPDPLPEPPAPIPTDTSLKARIVQITSSPVRHEFKPLVSALVRSNGLIQRYVEGGLPPTQLAWNQTGKVTLTGKVAPARAARLNHTPVLVPQDGWPPGTKITAKPDWAWRVRLVRDERPNSDIPRDDQLPELAGDVDESDPMDYGRVAVRHVEAAVQYGDHRRSIVFAPNISLLSLRKGLPDGSWVLTNVLLSRKQVLGPTAAANTVHVISLAPTPDPMPLLPPADEEPDD